MSEMQVSGKGRFGALFCCCLLLWSAKGRFAVGAPLLVLVLGSSTLFSGCRDLAYLTLWLQEGEISARLTGGDWQQSAKLVVLADKPPEHVLHLLGSGRQYKLETTYALQFLPWKTGGYTLAQAMADLEHGSPHVPSGLTRPFVFRVREDGRIDETFRVPFTGTVFKDRRQETVAVALFRRPTGTAITAPVGPSDVLELWSLLSYNATDYVVPKKPDSIVGQ